MTALTERLAEVLAEHEAEDTEYGYVCDCKWVSGAWTHGETRAEHRAHVAQALADALADHDRSVQAAALREAERRIEGDSEPPSPNSDNFHAGINTALGHIAAVRADNLDGGQS